MRKKQADNEAGNSLIGTAGVHYAAYRLTLKGMIALPTVRNTPGTDLVVTSLDGHHHANIQVKMTKNKRGKFWIICSPKKFEERKSKLGRNDYFLLLRPRRSDDPMPAHDSHEINELEGFMLTAQEANRELSAHLKYWKHRNEEPKFNLCIYVDKGPREKGWKLPPHSKNRWRKRWQEFQI